MASRSVKVQGLDKIEKALAELGRKIGRQVVVKALRDGAKVSAGVARSLAPVKTGRTRKAIKVRATKRKKGRVGIMVVVGAKWFQGDTFYAAFVHFGHKQGSRKLGDDRKDVPPNEWLDRAFEQSKAAAQEEIEKSLKAGLERAIAEVKTK